VRIEDYVAQTGARHIYHFTSTANLPLIRQRGLLSYQRMRALGMTPPIPGGSTASRVTDDRKGLDRYVHLCFLDNHPMEYVSRERLGETRFLKVNVRVLSRPGVLGCSKLANSRDAILKPIEQVLDDISLEALYGGLNGTCERVEATTAGVAVDWSEYESLGTGEHYYVLELEGPLGGGIRIPPDWRTPIDIIIGEPYTALWWADGKFSFMKGIVGSDAAEVEANKERSTRWDQARRAEILVPDSIPLTEIDPIALTEIEMF
jgi:ssDNA thymidine ADP-ribosyltransferase, DarT